MFAADPQAPVKVGAAVKSLPQQIETMTGETFGWLRNDSSDALLAVAIGVGLYGIFVLLRTGLVRVLGCDRDVTSWRGFAARIIQRTRTPFIAALAAYLVIHVVAPPGPLSSFIDFLFVISSAVQGAIWVREIVLAMVDRRAGASEDPAGYASAIGVIRVLVNVTVWIIAAILVLDNLGVNVTALVAGLGVGGIAIGLAAQGIFSDLFAAIAILFDRPFRVGETIQFGLNTGKVEAIGLKTVRIRLLSGEQLIVGNTQLLGQEVSNLKRIEERRIVQPLGVTYQTPPDVLEALPAHLQAVVDAVPGVRFDRAFWSGFGASSIDFELVFFAETADFNEMAARRHNVAMGIIRRFAELGVEFAYPTQTTFTAAPDGTMIDPRPVIEMPAHGEAGGH